MQNKVAKQWRFCLWQTPNYVCRQGEKGMEGRWDSRNDEMETKIMPRHGTESRTLHKK